MRELKVVKERQVVDFDFGGCPMCKKYDGHKMIGADVWVFCEEHRTKWKFPGNIYAMHHSFWCELPIQDNCEVLPTYTTVKSAWYRPELRDYLAELDNYLEMTSEYLRESRRILDAYYSFCWIKAERKKDPLFDPEAPCQQRNKSKQGKTRQEP